MRIARESFSAVHDGSQVEIEAGTSRVSDDHPLVRRYPDRFEEAEPFGVSDARGCEFRVLGPDDRSEPLFTSEMLDRAIEERERCQRIRDLAGVPGAREEEPPDLSRSSRRDNSPGGEVRARALRAIDDRASELSARAGDRLVALVERDQQGLDARYIAAISNPAYERAFVRMLLRPEYARHEISPKESEAMHEVFLATNARAMSIGDPASGGYGVPFALDPTVNLTSDGSVNPTATTRWAS